MDLIYNKVVLDKAKVDPTTIKTTKDLEAAFAKDTSCRGNTYGSLTNGLVIGSTLFTYQYI